MKHSELRETQIWKTQEGKQYLIKDLSDVHLGNIIVFLYRKKYFRGPLHTMICEQKYRKENNIINGKFVRKPFKLKRKKDLGN
jgi:hypothetical protein